MRHQLTLRSNDAENVRVGFVGAGVLAHCLQRTVGSATAIRRLWLCVMTLMIMVAKSMVTTATYYGLDCVYTKSIR